MDKHFKEHAIFVNRILLGLVMLTPGLLKIFVMGVDQVQGMLVGLGFPAAGLLAWVLALSEVGFGLAILVNWKTKYTVIPPIIILLVAAFTVNWGSWPSVLTHLVVASNFWMVGVAAKR